MLTKALFSFNAVIAALACTAPLLSELERRARNYIADGTIDPYVNDYLLTDNWYSVTKYEEQYLMPDSKSMPDYFTCGGYEPIYIKGDHPDIKTLTTTPINTKACLRNTFDDCDIEYDIKIRKCNKDIQYFLVGTKQHASYCFDPPAIQNGNAIFSDPPTDVELGNVRVNPILDFVTVSLPGGTKIENTTPYLKFECKFLGQEQYFYAINWYLNGRLYKVRGPTQDTEKLLITEKTMHEEDKINLGFTLKCGVRVSQDKTGRATTMVSSPDYFAGIKILNPRIDLPKDNQSTVRFQVTVPVGCKYNNLRPPACDMSLHMFDPDGYKCDQANLLQVKNSRKCGLNIKGAKKGDIWNYTDVYSFNVETGSENYNDRSDFILQLKAAKDFGHEWWNNYQPDNIMVTVTDNKVYQDKTCYAHVDPHMQTADGYNYECQEQGDYLMYRNTKYKIEVLIRTKECNKGKAQCICHVIIRAGADVFAINVCQTPRYINYPSCKDGGILRVIRENDNLYQVFTPIATYIDIAIYGYTSYYYGFMNVDMHMSPKDAGRTEGLCGFMDGNENNDLIARNGDTIKIQPNIGLYQRHHPHFTRSWRLKDEENLFITGKIKHLERWESNNAIYCVCEQAIVGSTMAPEWVAKSLCSPTQYLDCDFTRPTVTNTKCNFVTRRRRSVRSTNHIKTAIEKRLREADRLLRLANRPRKEYHHVKQRSVTGQNVTETEARLHCGNVINGSHVVSDIPDSLSGGGWEAVIDQCIFDVMAGNDLTLADVHVDAMNTIAQAKLKLDPVFVANNTAEVKSFIKNSCPGNCSQKGKCSDEGECDCDTYFHGSDCSIDERDPIVIDDLEGGGLCNLTDGDGCECFYVRTNNLLSNFTCAVSGVITYIDGTEENITTTIEAGEYEDIFTGLCCAPENRQRRSTSQDIEFSTRYDIAISNNGQTFGAAEPLHVYDSECQDALPVDEKGYHIVLKSGFCFIDGICITNKEESVTDDCFTCDPLLSVYNWTQSCKPTDLDDNNLGVILGATFGSIASVLMGIGIFSLWQFKLKALQRKRKCVGDSQIFSNTAVHNTERAN